ncbi:MAG TPA: glycogen debranching N-terminal domain-containing protein [Jiangellaceae bacterium]|nr:glycogen debranching N-terminal domain-containing protein [Jiangellaceae bacterium]
MTDADTQARQPDEMTHRAPQPERWEFGGDSVIRAVGSVTILDGSTFCMAGPSGDVEVGEVHGLFVEDVRVLSRWTLDIDGHRPELLRSFVPTPYHALFVSRARPQHGRADSALLVRRERFVGQGMREDIVVRSHAPHPTSVEVAIRVHADFADVFAVKEGRARPREGGSAQQTDEGIRFEHRVGERGRSVNVRAPGADYRGGALRWDVALPPHGEWRTTVHVGAHEAVDPDAWFPADVPLEHTEQARRQADWRTRGPVLRNGPSGLGHTLRTSRRDLGSLRILDPDHPADQVVAAGSPWFMALFGRDSLITSYMSLSLNPDLALGTVRSLARRQGTQIDPETEEQPGRILHEVRFGLEASTALGGRTAYYGTVDAAPLFVVLLGELLRWGAPREEVHALVPAADRALEWIETYGDRDGDLFVEYQRLSASGLANQGWKDSWDGVTYADGRVAQAPIALCEVQGYVYAAYLARAALADDAGDASRARRCRDRAEALRQAFEDAFWLPDLGWYALGLDADKRPIDSLTSNIGHCLWSGIVAPDRAARLARLLTSPEMFTGWGVRTLATSMTAYNPMSYHNGSVWPHDSAIVAAGLKRSGHADEAQLVARGILEAAEQFGGRLPELMCGFDRAEFPAPVPYPTSCSPQAWAAAAPLELVRVLLGAEPNIPGGSITLSPGLPESWGTLELDNVPLAGSRVSVRARGRRAAVTGLPPGLQVGTRWNGA